MFKPKPRFVVGHFPFPGVRRRPADAITCGNRILYGQKQKETAKWKLPQKIQDTELPSRGLLIS